MAAVMAGALRVTYAALHSRRHTVNSSVSLSATLPATHSSSATTWLNRSAVAWWVVTFIGQWAFLYYLIAFYGSSALHGDIEAWTKHPLLRKGYVPGDTAGNVMFGAHVLLAVIVTFGGTLQLVPWIRQRALPFHRWNGRLFLLTAAVAACGGLYLVWIRGEGTLRLFNSIAISGNAVLIALFATLAWVSARGHDVAAHRRWAMRAFIVANGVWFFRIGLFGWIIVNRGPVGITKALDGPFDRFWAYACYLLPLVILELYLRAKDSRDSRFKFAMAGGLGVFTVFMAIGIVGVSAFLYRFM